ncbi:MAG: hypothetical protein JST38_19985 [Bacteroidetes bacterium]|nr:hypothetical protein [Bacteroidota bacterium]MBS1943151.1 hypothetical protein [Bacteroidota bacterium]
MQPSVFLSIASTLMICACGQSETPENKAAAADLSSLQAQVAAITGKTYADPASQDTQDQFAQEAPAEGEQAFTSTGRQQPVQEQGSVRTITLPSNFAGIAMAQLQVPARWNVKTNASGSWYVDEPDLKVKDVNLQSFITPNSQMAQVYQQNGGKVRPAMTPEQVLQQDIAPQLRNQGYELIGSSDAPEVARAAQPGMDGLYSNGPQRNTCKANISTWRKGDQRMALLMHWSMMETPGMANWNYYFTRLDAPAARFEQEKAALLAAKASLRYNPQYFAAYAQSEQQKAGQSWAAHNQRMQTNQAAFDAQQRTHRETWGAINDASMSAYQDRMNSMDRQQNATINAIRGEQDAINPYTGEQGKIQSGQDQYWMNSDGQYIGTNDPNYDPNVNSDWVDQWRQAPAGK